MADQGSKSGTDLTRDSFSVRSLREIADGVTADANIIYWSAKRIEDLQMAISRIAHSNAQNGEDAMKMRNIATAVLYPEKKDIYDPAPTTEDET